MIRLAGKQYFPDTDEYIAVSPVIQISFTNINMATLTVYLAVCLTVCITLEPLARVGVAGVPLAANKRMTRSTCPTYCQCGFDFDLMGKCTCLTCGDEGGPSLYIGSRSVRFRRSSCPLNCPCGDDYDENGQCTCITCPGQQVAPVAARGWN